MVGRTSNTNCAHGSRPMRLKVGVNDLATVRPDLAFQAHGFNPAEVTEFSHKWVSWKCVRGHIWETTVGHRSLGNGCPYCSGHRVMKGYNDLATLNPSLAAQAHEFDPTSVTEFSDQKVGWRCRKNHVWEATISSRSKGRGCPYCSGLKILSGVNDLATLNPDLAVQARGFDPSAVGEFSHKKVGWRCDEGHEWEATIGNRASGHGCPYCSGRLVVAGDNDFAPAHPELASQAFGWDPSTMTKSSDKKVRWRCEEGHKWEASISNRSRGNGCPYCSGRRATSGSTDLATRCPDLAAEACGFDPTPVTG